MAQKVKSWIDQFFGRNAQSAFAEIFAQGPLVEHKANIKGRRQRAVNFLKLTHAKPMT